MEKVIKFEKKNVSYCNEHFAETWSTMGISSSSHHQSQGDSRMVKTQYGAVIGRRFVFENKQVDAFQGIPFAKPPIGELRFRKPEPPEPWDGVKETKAFGPRGIQKDNTFLDKMKHGRTSEDNLYLNVFSPTWNPSTPSGFAVLVFVHGGGFLSDSSVKYGDADICEHLCTKDVVVVTVQYRLGHLGFFTTGDDTCRGNFALWDQTMALRWIQDNITFFNGDPRNVTVMGQSAGGASVDLLSICPPSRDLFHRVIPMAGNASCRWSTHNNLVEVCRKFAEANDIHDFLHSEKMIEKLREVPASKFAMSLMDTLSDSKADLCPVAPRIDGEFITKPISELRKEAPGMPMLIGCCASEGLIMLMGKRSSLGGIMEEISKLVPEDEYPSNFMQLRQEIFWKLIKKEDIEDSDEVTRAYVEILGDVFTNIGVQKAVLETVEAHNVPVYFYSFDYFNPKSWGPLGLRMPFKDATHCTELAYIFAHGIIWSYDFNEEDKQMLEMTTRMWTNFAKYGDPNGVPTDESSIVPSLHEKPLKWEPATTECPQRHLSISLNPQMRDEYKTIVHSGDATDQKGRQHSLTEYLQIISEYPQIYS
ncbi:hypothetical protein Y032_0135g1884 [Ancylostoma ceylanicum]|uniref:Carboxylesterase type B domain-containing protein n=1 Tax=Ancylostoma ceylanicum TaxID=53326 RepID=A0A016T5K2_9BILA|nr:hypothetical protein Y032_0135g1884 [Ancylostoma ceylanicum]